MGPCCKCHMSPCCCGKHQGEQVHSSLLRFPSKGRTPIPTAAGVAAIVQLRGQLRDRTVYSVSLS
jgi:hypothetical protein